MQVKRVESRLEVDGIGGGNPDRWPVACLAPHAQCAEPVLRIWQSDFGGDEVEEFARLRCEAKVRLREPGAQRLVRKASVPDRRQNYERRIFVI